MIIRTATIDDLPQIAAVESECFPPAEAATKEINDGKPLLWSTTNDTYGPHTMAVAGYAHYHKVINFWLFTVIFEKLFYEIRDGWSAERRYYDMSGHLGLAAIISFDYK